MAKLSDAAINEKACDLASKLNGVEPFDRLLIIGEALDMIKSADDEYHSCGCKNWNITVDYREAGKRG